MIQLESILINSLIVNIDLLQFADGLGLGWPCIDLGHVGWPGPVNNSTRKFLSHLLSIPQIPLYLYLISFSMNHIFSCC